MVPALSLSRAFGEVVRAARLAKAWSQEDLAHRAGVHRTYIGDLENGRKSPTLDVVESLARALETTAQSMVSRAERTREHDEDGDQRRKERLA